MDLTKVSPDLPICHVYLVFVLSLFASIGFAWFLDASTHLYNRVCPSVGPYVDWSVRPNISPSVTNYFSSMNLIKNHDITSPSLKGTIDTAHHQHQHNNHYHLGLLLHLLRNHQSINYRNACLFLCYKLF